MPKARKAKVTYQTAAPPLPLDDGADDAGDLTYADKLFNAADLLRGAVAPYDYKYIKYVSDAFEDRHAALLRQLRDEQSEYYVEGATEEGGMFVQSARFVAAHQGNPGAITVYGEESLEATWKICRMNLAIRGITGTIALGNSFHDDKFKSLRADYVLANPPFNISKWRGGLLGDDARWTYGLPPDNRVLPYVVPGETA